MGYIYPGLEPDWVDDVEWDSEFHLDCEQDVESHPEGVECNDSCAPEDDAHMCGFSDKVVMHCVGQRSFSAYYTCPSCGNEGYFDLESGDDY